MRGVGGRQKPFLQSNLHPSCARVTLVALSSPTHPLFRGFPLYSTEAGPPVCSPVFGKSSSPFPLALLHGGPPQLRPLTSSTVPGLYRPRISQSWSSAPPLATLAGWGQGWDQMWGFFSPPRKKLEGELREGGGAGGALRASGPRAPIRRGQRGRSVPQRGTGPPGSARSGVPYSPRPTPLLCGRRSTASWPVSEAPCQTSISVGLPALSLRVSPTPTWVSAWSRALPLAFDLPLQSRSPRGGRSFRRFTA